MSPFFGIVPLLGHGGEALFWGWIMMVGGFVLPVSGALILGVIGKFLARHHSPRWRKVVQLFTAVALCGFLLFDAWMALQAVFGALSAEENYPRIALEVVLFALPVLLLIPCSFLLWRWNSKVGGDGVFQ